jgi:dienelactone hydrolase
MNAKRLFLILACALLLTTLVGQARAQELAKGAVIEKVVSGSDKTQSYAVYLPTSYTPDRLFPILYCFDPMARGAIAVSRFKDAAEKYNYIVVGSNNSRNGPNQPIAEIVRDIWADTHTRFSIDDKRVYISGFSGGARVAVSVGFWLKDRVAGVIACGGGFPSSTPLSTPRPFVLFLTAGTEDFNNPELQNLYRTLERSSPPVRLAIFEGGHSWLPSELAMEAIEWFEVQGMRSGIKARDQKLIDALFDRVLSQAHAAEDSKDLYRAYIRYRAAAEDFVDLHDVAEVRMKTEELKNSKDVRDAFKREKDMGDEQNRRIQNIHSLIASSAGAESQVELRDALRDLRKAATAAEPSTNRTIAKRVIESIFIEFFELANNAISRKSYDQAITHLLVCAEIQPDNPRVYYFLARAYVLNGNKKRALGALQNAAEKGFTGVKELEQTDFAELQSEKRFQEILESVRKNEAKRG